MERFFTGVRADLGTTSRRWSRLAVFFVSLVLLPGNGSTVTNASDQGPTAAVERALKEIIYILTELKDPSRSTQRQWELEQVIRRSFNYEAMAERSLGEAWAGLTAAERRQYVRLFVQLLRDEVADKLHEYSSAQIAYLSEQGNEESTQVLTAPAGLNIDARIEFQVVRRSGAWILTDLIHDGVSIVTNYRTQFSRILSEGSFSDLMEHMKQKAIIARVTEKVDS